MAEKSEAGGLNIHPMDQFVVQPLFGDGPLRFYSISNATLWYGVAILFIAGLLILTTRRRGMVPSRGQSMAEMIYGFVHKMVEDICGKEGLKYFPYIMAVFMFTLAANVVGPVFDRVDLLLRPPNQPLHSFDG